MESEKEPSIGREDLHGTLAMEREAEWPSKRREELARMEVVEVSPPYDVAEVTALLASRVIMNVLRTLVLNRKLGRIPSAPESEHQQPGE